MEYLEPCLYDTSEPLRYWVLCHYYFLIPTSIVTFLCWKQSFRHFLWAADRAQGEAVLNRKGVSASGISSVWWLILWTTFLAYTWCQPKKYTLKCCHVVSASHKLARVWRMREGCCTAPGQRGSVLWWHLLANQKGTNPPVGKLIPTFSIPKLFNDAMTLRMRRLKEQGK